MKKTLLFLSLGLLMVASLSSCETTCVVCHDCPQGVNLDGTEFCQDDFSSVDDYDTAVATANAQGCSCD